jgi:DNA-directed RNA polymerase specialized sigma subunit
MNATGAADLVERYCPLAKSIARKWRRDYKPLRDDLLSEAAYGLWIAAQRHDPARGFAFETLAHTVIKRRLITP